jgi:hypothetical protein
MRTVDFSSLLFRYCQVAGLDRNAITTPNYQQFRDFLTTRLEQAWKANDWPDLIRISDPISVSTGGTGILTATLPADCGEVLSVYNQDPRLTTRARLLKYFIYENGTTQAINMIDNVTPVYVEYRVRAPAMFGDPYSATVAYSAGAQMYFDTSSISGSFTPTAGKVPAGNLYECIVATTVGQSPATTPSAWSLIEIPYIFSDYLIRACNSDFLRSEGQFEQAMVAEREAEAALEREVDRILRSEGQVRRPSVFTY